MMGTELLKEKKRKNILEILFPFKRCTQIYSHSLRHICYDASTTPSASTYSLRLPRWEYVLTMINHDSIL